MLLFVAYMSYNMYLARNEYIKYLPKLIEKCYSENGRENNNYKLLAKWHKDQLKKFKNDTVYVFAGEFNCDFYRILLNDELASIIRKNNLKIVTIGGPYISVDANGSNKVIKWAQKGLIELYIRKDKRTIGHGIVSENSNKLCLLEDPHAEFKERAVTLFENSPDFCNKLRIKALKLKDIADKIEDFSEKSIQSFTKTKNEIEKKEKDVNYKKDERIQDESYLKQNSNPLKERIRLKWLAQII